MTTQPDDHAAGRAACANRVRVSGGALEVEHMRGVRRPGATVVQELSHAFPETGLTCVLILSDRTPSCTRGPKPGRDLDIFSCSTRHRSLDAVEELGRSFGARQVAVQKIVRADGHGPRSSGRP